MKDICGSPGDIERSNLGQFDAVVDNNGKDLKEVRPIIDWAAANRCPQFIFVSSCGIYKEANEPPHVEGDAIKKDASHAMVEVQPESHSSFLKEGKGERNSQIAGQTTKQV